MKQMAEPQHDRISFTYCPNFANADTKAVTWSSFVKSVTRSEEFLNKQASIARAAIVGGVREDEARGRADNVKTRTILTLDFDDLPGLGLDDIEFQIDVALAGNAYVAYSTYRSTPAAPRIRVFVPLSRAVGPREYAALVDRIAYDLVMGDPDPCSKVMAQIFFLASHQPGVEPWSVSGDGAFLDVDALDLEVEPDREQPLDDLERLVAVQPLDISDDEVDGLLEAYPAEPLDYDGWLRVGMMLAHQYEGGDEGYDRWLTWSAKSSKHDPQQMRTKWRSFSGRASPVTLRSLIKAVGGRRAISPAGEAFEGLESAAAGVKDMVTWDAFKGRVRNLEDRVLTPDVRAVLASVVYVGWAKAAGLTLTETKVALKHPPVKRAGAVREAPAWLAKHGYIQDEARYVNISTGGRMNKDAFNVSFRREPEVEAAEIDAVGFASTICPIQLFASTLYWPGLDRVFLYRGAHYLNTWIDDGAVPKSRAEWSEAGHGAVERLQGHLRGLVEDDRERRILIDWLSWVYQNPGDKTTWGLVLQGSPGNGKTYLQELMRGLLGTSSRTVAASSITGNFSGWADKARLIVIEEIRFSGQNRHHIMDKLKPFVSNASVSVEAKGQDPREVPNFGNYLLFTNAADALPIDETDRRYCVIETATAKENLGGRAMYPVHGSEEAYNEHFARLFSDLNNPSSVSALAGWLGEWARDAGFTAQGTAPMTKGRAQMIEATKSEAQEDLEGLLEEYASPVVSDTLLDTTWLRICSDESPDHIFMPNGHALKILLLARGLRKAGRVKVQGIYHQVWSKPGVFASDEDAHEAVRDWHDTRLSICKA